MTWARLASAAAVLALLSESLAGDRLHAQEATADPASGAIRVYQQHLSAMRHMHCRFTPSCSQYASDAIARYGVVEGSARAADRLMRCNTASETRYPRGLDGLLADSVGGPGGSPASVHVPHWLAPGPDTSSLPVARGVSADRRLRLAETLEFARELEARGDCERASGEWQRAGSLADTLAAHAWAYSRIGDCYLGSAQWYFADRAYLTSAMLTREPSQRVRAGYAAAASRFDAGAFVACAGLLGDPELDSLTPASSPATIPVAGVPALAGLCAFAAGDWMGAGGWLKRARAEAAGTPSQSRIERLTAAAGEGPGLPHRSIGLAGAMSAIIPGSGQMYCGNIKDGVRHLLFDAALIYTVVALATNEQVPAAVIVGTVALPFYVGNVLGARDTARRHDRDQRMRLLARAIDDSSR